MKLLLAHYLLGSIKSLSAKNVPNHFNNDWERRKSLSYALKVIVE